MRTWLVCGVPFALVLVGEEEVAIVNDHELVDLWRGKTAVIRPRRFMV